VTPRSFAHGPTRRTDVRFDCRQTSLHWSRWLIDFLVVQPNPGPIGQRNPLMVRACTRRSGVRFVAMGVLFGVLLSGCGNPGPGPPKPTAESSVPLDDRSQRLYDLAETGDRVTFTTLDGVLLRGLVLGGGDTAVVMSHMGRAGDSLEDWLVAATELASSDRSVLIYNRRGICAAALDLCSEGTDELDESWRDVVAADRQVRRTGATRVVHVGASIGAMATFHAVSLGEVDPDGLVWMGGVLAGEYTFDRSTARRLPRVPSLYVSSMEDIYGGREAARRMYEWTRDPHRLVLLPGMEHGTDFLKLGARRSKQEHVIAEIDRLIADVERR